MHLFADCLHPAEGVVRLEERLRAGALFGCIEPLDLQRTQQHLAVFGQRSEGSQARRPKTFRRQCPAKSNAVFPRNHLASERNARWALPGSRRNESKDRAVGDGKSLQTDAVPCPLAQRQICQ